MWSSRTWICGWRSSIVRDHVVEACGDNPELLEQLNGGSSKFQHHLLARYYPWGKLNQEYLDMTSLSYDQHIEEWHRLKNTAPNAKDTRYTNATGSQDPLWRKSNSASTDLVFASPLLSMRHEDTANNFGLVIQALPFGVSSSKPLTLTFRGKKSFTVPAPSFAATFLAQRHRATKQEEELPWMNHRSVWKTQNGAHMFPSPLLFYVGNPTLAHVEKYQDIPEYWPQDGWTMNCL